jgi:hypothetical protein
METTKRLLKTIVTVSAMPCILVNGKSRCDEKIYLDRRAAPAPEAMRIHARMGDDAAGLYGLFLN